MAVDMDELASAVFGTRSAERSASRDEGATTTVYGRATSDSAGGVVSVALDGVTLADDDGDGAIEVSTTTAVREGDDVIVTLVGPATGRHPIVTGVVGRGDEQQAQMEACESAITQASDRIESVVSRTTTLEGETESLGTRVTQTEDGVATLVSKTDAQAMLIRASGAGVEVGKVDSNGAYTSGRTKLDEDSFDILSKSGETIASYGADKVELGKNSASAIIELCNGNGKISTANTWTTIESPKTGNLEMKGGVGTEQQAFVRVSGGDRPQVSLVRTDGIADANSVIQMSGSGVTIDGGERGVTTGRIKLGGGTMLKAVYCGSTVVYVDQIGNAKLLSGSTYGTKEIGRSSLFVSSGDHHVYARNISAWWANDSSGDWWVHTEAANKNIRVNWTLIKW